MNNALNDSLKVSMFFSEPSNDWLAPSCLSGDAVERPLLALFRYIKPRSYEGPDPFDGASSLWLKFSPLGDSRMIRLGLSRFCKKSSVNFRTLLMVPRSFSPLGGALFLLGYLNWLDKAPEEVYENEAYILFQRLKHTRIPRGGGSGWGHPFDWQTRSFYAPTGTPDLMTTVWVGRALLAYYQRYRDADALHMALSTVDFILNEMVRACDTGFVSFRYIPGSDVAVHSVNLAGAAYLAQLLAYLPREAQAIVRERIAEALRFSFLDIGSDGSWPYGTGSYQRWTDHYHTTVCIEHLLTLYEYLRDEELLPILRQVTGHYLLNLFTEDGFPMTNGKHLYPIELNAIAQAVALIPRLRRHRLWSNASRLTQVENGLLALVQRFQDPKGFFYHRQNNRHWNKIAYMRWGQAPMFYALSLCLEPL